MRNRGLGRTSASVVVIGAEPRAMGLIRECLGTEAALPNHSTPYEEAISAVRKGRPNVVILGMDAKPEEAIRLGTTLAAEFPGLQLVAVSERNDPERIRAAMRAGFREYSVLPAEAEELRRAVKEAAKTETEDITQGEVIALVGSKGGCGVTFLAINLAAEISSVERVCVVDLDFSMGDVAAFLDLQPTSSVQELLRNLDRLDERMLAGSVTVHPSKVHVLAQPTELLGTTDEVNGDHVLRVLSTAANAYNYVLVDCGGRVDEATLTASSVADTVFLVCTPDVPSVKNAWRRLQLMDRLGVGRDVVRLIVNKWDKSSELTTGDIEKNLGLPVAATIDYDPAACHKAVNAGRLLREIDKRSPTSRDINDAVSLITEHVKKVEKKQASSPFSWFRK